jgi:hypothetical protein
MVAGSAKASGTYLVWLVFPLAWLAPRTGRRAPRFVTLVLLLNCVTTVSGPWLDQHLALKLAANYIPLYALLALGVWLAGRNQWRPR